MITTIPNIQNPSANHAIQHQLESAFPQVIRTPLTNPSGNLSGSYHLWLTDHTDTPVGKPHSNRYRPHSLNQIVQLTQAASKAFQSDDVKITTHWDDGHYVTVQPPSNRMLEIMKGDNLIPRIIIQAPYNLRAIRINVGLYRLLCKNLMMFEQLSNTKSINKIIRHMGSLEYKFSDIVNSMGDVIESFQQTVQQAEQMSQTTIDTYQLIEHVFGPRPSTTGRGQTVYDNRTNKITSQLCKEVLDLDQTTSNGWLNFNAVQHYIQHSTNRHGEQTTVAREMAALNNQHIRRAEQFVLAQAA